jgi:hypothetical protein
MSRCIPTWVECGAVWLPADRERWQAHLGCDEHLDEAAEVAFTARRRGASTASGEHGAGW